MYKKMLLAVLPIFAFMVFLPQPSEAARFNLEIPADAIGVTEDTYNSLVQKERCDIILPATDIAGGACSDTIRNLNGKVIVRTWGYGQMYKMDLVNGNGDGIMDIQIRPYVPDGFYTVDKKVYWVANGSKMRLKKGKAYAKFFDRITHDYTSRLPLSEYDFSAMNTTCEYYGGDKTPFDDCVKKADYGEALMKKFEGKILMRAEVDGSLEHALPDGSTVFSIGPKNNSGIGGVSGLTFFQYTKLHSIAVSDELMSTIPRY